VTNSILHLELERDVPSLVSKNL